MTLPLARAASILQFGYAAMLTVVGAVGILSARWELNDVFGIDASSWAPEIRSTMLNQYRFLKSIELGAGLFCLIYRSEILAGRRASKLFLTIVGLGVAARGIAWIVDGRPATAFIVFLALELLVFVAVAAHLRLMDVTSSD